MAYVNVAEWKTDQVCEWLKGLDNTVLPYVHSFMNHGVNGQQLLGLRPEDLEHLGVLKLGHQEIILEAVEYLRNFHYELDRENLQLLALRLSCQAHSLHNELSRQSDSKPVKTQTLSDVAVVVMAVKPLVRWLDRPPFSGQLEYNDKKAELMKLSLEMATCAQRDRFAEKPIEEIRTTCGQLAKLADYIIQDIADPMILQPASLDLATLKKKAGDDLGFCILPSFHGAHQIAEIKFGSAAHQCGKMEEGDEIVQVNYQTVVGWERKNVLELFRESPAEVLLTLKRRPRHTKVYGQIYIKPYRLPSNKKTPYTTRWQHNLPSPRPELLTIPDFTMPLPRNIPKNPTPEPTSILDTVNMLDTIATDSSDSDSEVEQPMSIRLYSAKPRNLVQRRATITGASPTTKHGIDIDQLWKELKQEHRTTFQLRDKAASCAHGLDNVPSNIRPQTCLGIEHTKRKKKLDGQTDDRKLQLQEKSNESEEHHTNEPKTQESEEGIKFTEKSQEDVMCNDRNAYNSSNQLSANFTCSNTNDTTVPSNECNTFVANKHNANKNILNGKEQIVRNKERGKLDKSYSTPAYDLTDTDENNEDRKFVLPECCVTSNENVNTPKNDSLTTTENITKFERDNGKENEYVANDLTSKISNTEKSLYSKEHTCNVRVPEKVDSLKNIVHITVSDETCKNSIKENQSNNDVTLETNIENKIRVADEECTMELNEAHEPLDNRSIVHESSEEKSESVSSYIEGTCSSSSSSSSSSSNSSNNSSNSSSSSNNSSSSSNSNGDPTLKKFGEILETIDSALTAHSKLIEQSVSVSNEQLSETITQNVVSSDDDLQNNTNQEISNNEEIRKNDTKNSIIVVQGNITRSCKEIPKSEIKSQSTPPEPPPRRYFSKPGSQEQNVDNSYQTSENEEKPQIPERPIVRRDLKRIDIFTDNYVKNEMDHHEKNSSFESYANFVEKSTDYIDESNATISEQKFFHSDVSLYSDHSEREFKEERHYDKHDPTVENYSNMNHPTTSSYRIEYSRNVDFPDGSNFSKQIQFPDYKPRTLEKDKSFEKSVVNRAMMVARSIGLHGSLGKSCNSSPRSGRKRNTLLAKKRNVSVKDVGTGDLEGWLTYRSRGAGGAWAKAWFVLKCSSLYRFKTQDSIKADCLIALTGFTVSQAAEVKSRKYAFKIYHTGTVFYFAADTEDSLLLWLDAVNKATLGTDAHNRNSGLFSETDESDSEYKSKTKTSHSPERKQNVEKAFGSLKKTTKKDTGFKDHEISGASLDRKYLRFLGAKNQNLPVPTAQFRSYRRVLPTSTPNKKPDFMPNSPDLQMTIAGSTFYGLSASQSATDMSSSNQDMGDYRRTTDRSLRNRRTDELQGFITLEEFMLSQQDEEQRRMAINRSISPRTTPLTADHVHVQHRNFNDTRSFTEQPRHVSEMSPKNGIYNQLRSNDEISSNHTTSHRFTKDTDSQNTLRQSNNEFNNTQNDSKMQYVNDRSCKCKGFAHKKSWECNCGYKKKVHDSCSYQMNHGELSHWKNHPSENCKSFSSYHGMSDIPMQTKSTGTVCDHNGQIYSHGSQNTSNQELCYPGSSRDLTRHTSSETLQRVRKEVSVTRKGSFNLTNRRDQFASEKNWLDSLKRSEKKNMENEKSRLKNVAQYQPPPIPSSPFEQEGMRAAFEMHLDKHEQVQKSSRLKSLFGTKCQQKPCTLDLPKDTQKTLLGSPRLHRALFRDKSSNYLQSRPSIYSDTQSPGDSGISQSLSSFSGNSHSQTLSSASSISDWSPDTSISNQATALKHNHGHSTSQKANSASNRNCAQPMLSYIPPPTSPPPDYPGLEYPPVFEPGTYSLSDASLLRNRSRNNQNNVQ